MHILVCVTGQKTCRRLIDEGARLALDYDADLSVLHVARTGADFLDNPSQSEAIEYLYQISAAHGADMTLIKAENVLDTLAAYARRVEADLVVIGASRKGDRNFAHDLSLVLPHSEIHVVSASDPI